MKLFTFRNILISFITLILIQGCSMVKPLFEPISEEDSRNYRLTSAVSLGLSSYGAVKQDKDFLIGWGVLGLYYAFQSFNTYEENRVKNLPQPTNEDYSVKEPSNNSIDDAISTTPKSSSIQPITNRHTTQQKNINLNLKIINTPSVIQNDYIEDFTLEVTHPTGMEIDKSIIYLDDTQILPLLEDEEKSINKTVRHYRLGIPKGINSIEAYVTTKNAGVSNTDYATVESKSKAKPTLHIVAIGVKEFPQWNESGLTLENAIKDRQLVIDTFNKKSKHLFGNDNVKFYPEKINSSLSTKEAIQSTVESIRNNVKPNDYFLFYVSSHGNIVNEKYHFSPSNYSYDEENEVLKNEFGEDDLSEYLINILTIFRLVILDTCHSGKQVSSFTEQLKKRQLGDNEGVSVLTASKDTESANANYKGYGLFTYVLAKGLSGDADVYPKKDYMVDSMEIAKYLEKNVSPLSKTEGMPYEHTAVTYSNKRFDLTLLRRDKKPDELKPDIYSENEKRKHLYQISKNLNNQTVKVYNAKTTSIKKIAQNFAEQGTIDLSVNFELGSANITAVEASNIRQIAKILQEQNFINKKVIIEGHTDNTGAGSPQQRQINNLNLSRERANTIARILIEEGLNINRLEVIGYGEIKPLTTNNTENGRRLNRRVSISIE